MKKIFDRRVYIKLSGWKWKEFIDTSIWRHLVYELEDNAKETSFLYNSFSDFLEEAKKDWIYNLEVKETFFKHLPVVNFSNFGETFSITQKNFSPIEVKIVYEPVTNLSLKTLSELLNADDFCEYLKDRGVGTYPILNKKE